jgi:hypothetical protein
MKTNKISGGCTQVNKTAFAIVPNSSIELGFWNSYQIQKSAARTNQAGQKFEANFSKTTLY